MGEEKEKTDAIFDLLKLRIDAVTAMNGWKGTGKAKVDTGEKYPAPPTQSIPKDPRSDGLSEKEDQLEEDESNEEKE